MNDRKITDEHLTKIQQTAKTPWECPHCHRTFTLNAKGNHLKHCILNPDRAPDRHRPGKQVTCEFCDHKMKPTSLTQHINKFCSVAKAIREGRLTAIRKDQLFPASSASFELQQPRIVEANAETNYATGGAYSGTWSAPTPLLPQLIRTNFDETTVTQVIELAVEQALDGGKVSYLDGRRIHYAVRDLVQALREAVG